MKPITAKELAKLLESNGGQLLRIAGSDHIYGKSGAKARISVLIHGNKTLRAGLAIHLLKAAGLRDE